MSAAESSSLKLWEFVSMLGFIFVIGGVVGESAELLVEWGRKRSFRRKLWRNVKRCFVPIIKRIHKSILPIETLFFALLVIGLGMEFIGEQRAKRILDRDNERLNLLAGEANAKASGAQLESVKLNKAVLELAHQYDLSTNALAEANARLASIRPIKERLVGCLNDIDPKIIPELRGGKTKFRFSLPSHLYTRFISIVQEPEARSYITSVELDGNVHIQGGIGQVHGMNVELKQELVK